MTAIQKWLSIDGELHVVTFADEAAPSRYPRLQVHYPCIECGVDRDVELVVLTEHGPVCKEAYFHEGGHKREWAHLVPEMEE